MFTLLTIDLDRRVRRFELNILGTAHRGSDNVPTMTRNLHNQCSLDCHRVAFYNQPFSTGFISPDGVVR